MGWGQSLYGQCGVENQDWVAPCVINLTNNSEFAGMEAVAVSCGETHSALLLEEADKPDPVLDAIFAPKITAPLKQESSAPTPAKDATTPRSVKSSSAKDRGKSSKPLSIDHEEIIDDFMSHLRADLPVPPSAKSNGKSISH